MKVQDYRKPGDGDDWALALQRAVDDKSNPDYGVLEIPAGDLYLRTPVVINMADHLVNTLKIYGNGIDSTRLMVAHDHIGIELIGDKAGSVDAHMGGELSSLSVIRRGAGVKDGAGIHASSLAFWKVSDVMCSGFDHGMRCTSLLSSYFERCRFQSNKKGLYASKGDGFSNHNAVAYQSCIFRMNTQAGAELNGAITVNFESCNFEANGTDGNLFTGGLIARLTGIAGNVGVNLSGCYFEHNRAGYDIIALADSSPRTVVCNDYGSTFNRISSKNYCRNNILIRGSVRFNLFGSGFDSYNDYSAGPGESTLRRLDHTSVFQTYGSIGASEGV